LYTSGHVATFLVRLIFAIVSACGLHFRLFGPQLDLRPQFSVLASTRFKFLSSIIGAIVHVCAAALMMSHHGDDV